METNNVKKIFTRKVALYLRQRGFKIVGTEPNYKHPEYDVYMFLDSPQLQAAITDYNNMIRK